MSLRVLACAALLVSAAPALSPPLPETPPAPVPACQLMTMEEARRFIPGTGMRPGFDDGEMSDCGWFADPTGTTIGAALTQASRYTAEGTTAAAYFDEMIANPSLPPKELISGIGDRAAIEQSEGEDARFVYVVAGGKLLILTIIYLPDETAIEIARIAAARMGS